MKLYKIGQRVAINLSTISMSDIYGLLKQYWGYDHYRPLQEDIIRSVLAEKDTLALMPTGGGKSITYQIPGLLLEGICLVVTPLIALMKDQVEELKKREICAEAIYTGLSSKMVESVINKCIGGKVKFLYVSPERLGSSHFRERLKQMKISLLAVDEAHCISQWGYDFRPSYLKIAEIRVFFPSVSVLALTATATPKVAEDIQKQLKFSTPHILSKSFRRDNISYVVRQVNDKYGELLHILSKLSGGAIVYVRTRTHAEEVASFLTDNNIQANFYHAGLTSAQREKKQDAWKKGEIPVIVTTNAFGMGIDKPDVRIVVHFDIPDSPEAYFQEAGRGGRDGLRAYAVLLYNRATLMALKKRITQGFPDKKYIREIYRLLGNYFMVEEGTGSGFAFEFDRDDFIKRFKLEYIPAFSAIEILQVAGYLECTTEVHAKSRICFLVLRDQLYKIELHSISMERLMEYILRTCSGVFVQYAYIDEEVIADYLGITRQEVYEALQSLAKRKILSYVPGNDCPYIVYHQPRVPESYLHIGPESYELRKKSYTVKVEQMVGYVELEGKCRQLYLMEYFGQKEKTNCGVCDYCLTRKKRTSRLQNQQIDQSILNKLQESDQELKELIMQIETEADRGQIITRIRTLLDENRIYYKNTTLLALKQ